MKLSMAVTVSSLLLLLLLLLSTTTLGSKTDYAYRGPYHPAECCFRYTGRPVPRFWVAEYYETSSQCSKPGIVFISKKGSLICADPREKWVQDYIMELEEK